MNQQQCGKALAVARQDCTGRYLLMDETNGKTCFVGALLLSLEISLADIKGQYTPNVEQAELLRRQYGLTSDHICKLSNANDAEWWIPRRRSRVVKLLTQILEEGQ